MWNALHNNHELHNIHPSAYMMNTHVPHYFYKHQPYTLKYVDMNRHTMSCVGKKSLTFRYNMHTLHNVLQNMSFHRYCQKIDC